MGTITIYLSLVDGQLFYRDSEDDKGKTIDTSVDPGDKIIWTLDENSGISDLSGINIIGSCKFFSKGPKKKDCDKWTAKVSKKAIGEIGYEIYTTPSITENDKSVVKMNISAKQGDVPKLTIRI